MSERIQLRRLTPFAFTVAEAGLALTLLACQPTRPQQPVRSAAETARLNNPDTRIPIATPVSRSPRFPLVSSEKPSVDYDPILRPVVTRVSELSQRYPEAFVDAVGLGQRMKLMAAAGELRTKPSQALMSVIPEVDTSLDVIKGGVVLNIDVAKFRNFNLDEQLLILLHFLPIHNAQAELVDSYRGRPVAEVDRLQADIEKLNPAVQVFAFYNSCARLDILKKMNSSIRPPLLNLQEGFRTPSGDTLYEVYIRVNQDQNIQGPLHRLWLSAINHYMSTRENNPDLPSQGVQLS